MLKYQYPHLRSASMEIKYYEKMSDNNNIKINESSLNYHMPAHFHKAVELHYILENPYEIVIQDKTYVIEQNSILIIPPYMTHGAKMQKQARNLVAIIPYDYFTYFPFFLRTNTPFFCLSDKSFNRETILPILKLFLSQSLRNDINPNNKEILNTAVNFGWTNLIFGRLFSYYQLNFSFKETFDDSFEKILDYIDSHYGETNLTLATLAPRFGYNPSYFSRLFKNTFSVSLKRYINQTRVRKFIDLFSTDTTQNILTLALNCGFNSQATFHRVFFEYTKTNPSNYFNLPKTI